MIFKVGDTVVYPHHGAALVEAIETRTIKGEPREYLVLKVAQGDLTVRVPADNAEYVGVRDVVGQEGLDKVFQVLRAPHTEQPTTRPPAPATTRPTWRSSPPVTSTRSLKSCVICGAVTRSEACRPARSACWPRPGRFWSVSWRWPRAPMRPRPTSSWTRFSPPLPEFPESQGTGLTGTVAVVPAAGSGERLAAGVPKAFFQLEGRTLVERAVDGLLHSGVVDRVVVAVPPDRTDRAKLI